MRKEILILASIIMISACSNQREKKNKQLEQSIKGYDTLNIHDISINNMSVITDTNTLFDNFGYPESIIEYGGFFTMDESDNTKYKLGEKVEYQAFSYEGLSFAVWDDQVRLRRVNFVNTYSEIKTSKGIFSNKTTIKEIQRIFPNSFERRSSVKNYAMIDDNIVTEEDTGKKYNEPLCLMNGVAKDFPDIELNFANNRLASIYIRSWN